MSAASILAAVVCLAAGIAIGLLARAFRRDGAESAGERPAVDERLAALEDRIGFRFARPEFLEQAMTHSSFANETGGTISHNETMEFLGDAVIELVTTDVLFTHRRDMREGEMSKLRAMVVNKQSLSQMAAAIDLGAALRLSVGERQSGGRRKASLLANAYEALVGAVFLDAGFARAQEVFTPAFKERIDDALAGRLDTMDYKTRLQEVCQARFGAPPIYRITSETGPDHDKRFESELTADGRILGTGRGRSKKEAEQDAAREALDALDEGDA